MKFSLWPHAGRAVDQILGAARLADTDGWYGVWLADHYMPNTADGRVADGPMQECWTLLPAIATVTERVRIGPLVSPTSVHHPALLANRAASLDQLCGGRLVLGLGAGWQVNEHAAYGIELEAPGARVSRFEEAVQIIRSLLTEDRTSYAGSVYRITDAPCDPKPVQARLPLLAGTAGPRMLRITARHLDEWNTWGDLATALTKRGRLLEACERVGRDPGTMRRSVNAFLDLDGTSPGGPGRTLSGSAERLIDELGRFAEAGFEEFVVPDWLLAADPAQRHDQLRRLKADVLDRVGADQG
ncbi:MAG: LLM class flavin-dependent oxidoreductase [Nocardioides sp.]|uniref:LLM class flavin-dependent oxidoreductase n=1 Tax=Nocardioides sp. TaxID=35761 RepID=UPI0039E5A35A